VAALRQQLCDQGFGRQGRERSVSEELLAVGFTNVLQEVGLSHDQAVKQTAQVFVASPHTIRATCAEFAEEGKVAGPSQARGSGNPSHPLHISNSILTLAAETELHRLLGEVRETNSQETVTTLRAGLEKAGHRMSRPTVHRALQALSYKYTNKSFIGAMTFQTLRARRRAFVYQLARAHRLQQNGTHVIVVMDESYTHQRRATTKIWANTQLPDSHLVRGDADGGQRLIVVDAMTGTQLLRLPDLEPSPDLKEKCASTELVFQSHGSDGDYHKCMNGETFSLWMRNRLFPAFNALYPGKKMILMLDNVRYHHHRGLRWISPQTMNQDALAVTLAEHMPSLTVTRGGKGKFQHQIVIPKRNFQNDPKAKRLPGPTLGEMRAALTEWLKAHPQQTEIARLMEEAGHELLYTPPFQPEAQPIELLWGTVKAVVARQHVRGRTIHQTQAQLRAALAGVTSEQIAGYWEHVHSKMDGWVQADEELAQFGTFKKLVNSPGLVTNFGLDINPVEDEHDESDSDNDSDADD
jgi:transposase